MWIIPRNLRTSHSVRVTEESTSDSNERLAERFAQSLMWRSKPSPSRTWSRRLKTDISTQRLSTRILSASRGDAFADEWTSSLVGSLVSHLAPPEEEPETQTLDTSFPTSSTVSESWDDLPLFSLKMLRGSSHQSSRGTDGQTPKGRPFCCMSSESWSAWVMTRRREYSQRVKSARPISESASLSWVVAPISASQDAILFQNYLNEGEGKPRSWPTPNTSDGYNPNLPHDIGRNYLRTECLTPQEAQMRGAKSPSGESPNQVQPTPRQEAQSSTRGNRPASPAKLNPRWVEALMGLPIGWVMPSCVDPWTIEPTSSDCSEMELSQTQLRELFASCGEISVSDIYVWKSPIASDGEGGVLQYVEGSSGKYKLRDQATWENNGRPIPQAERTVYLIPREEFDGALLRIEEGVAIYSAERVIEVYMKRGMSEDDARDFFSYNCEGAYVGPFTPRYEWQEFDE